MVDVPWQHVDSAGRRWPVSWLVLALVIERPSHGYEIAQRYESRFGWLQSLAMSRVYAALSQLHELRLVEEVELETIGESSGRRPARRSYRATAAGARAYRGWVSERFADEMAGLEMLERVASVSILGVDGMIEVVRRLQEQCLAEIHALSAHGADRLADLGLAELARWLAFDQYRRGLQARMGWTADALEVLEEFRQAQQRTEPER